VILLDKNLALEFVRVTESAAIASARWMGRGDKHSADKAATEIMRKRLNLMKISGKIVIGEGERDDAPMLFIGEKVGKENCQEIDIAVDPLECTDSVAYGKPNAISVMAAAPKGTMLHAPDIYMDKIAVGPEAVGVIDLDASVEENLKAVAKAKKMDVKDLLVCVLDRPRHKKLIEDIRKIGSRITLISDGDISGAISTCLIESEIDILMGIGAAPEGVIAAAAINCLGGEMQCRLRFTDFEGKELPEIKERARKMGITDFNKKMTAKDLVKTDSSVFVATGISTGSFLKGVDFTSEGAITYSIVMRQKSGTIRFIETHHRSKSDPGFD
jgi:fructose-1,6-bisphosphatase class II